MPELKKEKITSAELTPKDEEELSKLEEEITKSVEKPSKEAKGEEITPAPESAPEELKTPKSEKKPEPKPLEEGEEKFSDEDVAHLKPKAQKRFRKLSEKAVEAKELKKEVAYLRKQAGFGKVKTEPVPAVLPSRSRVGEQAVPGTFPWDAPSGEPREVTEGEFQEEVGKTAQQIVRKELSSYKVNESRLTNLKEDVKSVERDYSELNADNEENYDQALATSIANWFTGLYRSNPNLRLASFVNELMGLRKKGAEREKGKVTAKVAKQAAKQAVTSTGTPIKQRGVGQVIESAETIDELEKAERLLPHAG